MRRYLYVLLPALLVTSLFVTAAAAEPPAGKGWKQDGHHKNTTTTDTSTDTSTTDTSTDTSTTDTSTTEPTTTDTSTVTADPGNPFAAAPGWVDPYSQAKEAVAAAEASGDTAKADLLRRIADTPQAVWWGDWNPTSSLEQDVAARTAEIRGAGALPLYVVYAIPLRDCGQYSAGGTNSPTAYREWIQAFAAGVGSGPAAVVLEPDALAQLDCLDSTSRTDRLQLLGEAVDTLAARGISVYLDAGNSAWHSANVIADRLREANVANARGFALNVSNYRWTNEAVAYGREVASLVGDKPFVVDTSRNGQGPTADGEWCNPVGRGLGPVPVAAPTDGVDALAWIKRPGESDGECNGGPAAGQWYDARAVELAELASSSWGG